jgi:hypothetical protein
MKKMYSSFLFVCCICLVGCNLCRFVFVSYFLGRLCNHWLAKNRIAKCALDKENDGFLAYIRWGNSYFYVCQMTGCFENSISQRINEIPNCDQGIIMIFSLFLNMLVEPEHVRISFFLVSINLISFSSRPLSEVVVHVLHIWFLETKNCNIWKLEPLLFLVEQICAS